MKGAFCFLATAGVMLLAQRPVAAETINWKCDFKGTYTVKGESGTKSFTWNVSWTESDGKMDKVTGKSSEEGSTSTTVGTCDAKTCLITETYTSGEEKGKVYYWTGDYTDTETKDEDVYVTTIKGTWGPSASDRKSGGTWQAKADCKR